MSKLNHFHPARASRRRFLALLACGAVAACSTEVEYRGYQARQGDLEKVRVGMSKTEVEGILGSPSTTATIKHSGDSYYYITSVVEQRAFLDPEEIDRRVFAIRFDDIDQVKSFGHYGLKDGRVISISGRETPTRGREMTILQQIFTNIGRYDAGPARPK